MGLCLRHHPFDAPDVELELLKDGSLNWTALIEALKSSEPEQDKPLPRLLVKRVELKNGRIGLADRKVDFATHFDPLNLTLSDVSTLPDDKGEHLIAATSKTGAKIHWRGDFSLTPVAARGELAIEQIVLSRYWPYLQGHLALKPPEGVASVSLDYRAGYADKQFSLNLDKIRFDLQGLALQGVNAAEPSIRLDRLSLGESQFDLQKQTLNLGRLSLDGGRITLQRNAAGRLDIQDWLPQQAAAAKVEPAAPSAAPEDASAAGRPSATKPWLVNLSAFALNGLGIHYSDAGFVTPLRAEIGNLQIGFVADAEVGGAQTRAKLDQLGVDVSGIRLFSGPSASPLFVLGGIALEQGRIDLAERQAVAGRVSLSNGQLDLVRTAQGSIALLDSLVPVQSAATARKPDHAAAAADGQGDWQYRVGQVDLAGFRLALRDEAVQPAAALTLDRIEASVSGVSDDLKAALPVRLGFHVEQGGRFQAEGKVIPATPAADVGFNLAGLALMPAQPYLTQAANLTLASGKASAKGRVKFESRGQETPKVRFEGGFEVADLLLNETDGGARFLAWKKLSSDSLRANPNALELDELQLDRLDAKLIIFKDKSVNLTRILKSAPPPVADETRPETDAATASRADQPSVPLAAAKAAPPAGPNASAAATPSPPAFRVNIDRVRIADSEMEFADYSLALPFGTRIHSLKGTFNGISTQSGSLAELEIDGQVDEYGLARAVGQIDLFDPTGFMDIKTVFRNVEMVNLTPYSATFAGRKIASGKLSLDLEYKIKQRQLLGENQIIMDKLTLGERVESPGAKNLPLDLAIAILQDSDGRIDLGLPVSGSLDDPQFSYGRIIWKAIGNILTKIVTAPFRALGALFGGGGEKLESLAFEAGESDLTPPEKEKFKQIAQILNKRPGLALSIHGVWVEDIDRPVMKETQLRRAVAEKMGIKLAPNEDAGPISTANPKSRNALEVLYAQRFSEADWLALKTRWTLANPDKNPQSGTGKMMSRLKGLFKKEEPLSADELAQLKDADLHGLLYQRLLEKETVSDEMLKNLARLRGETALKGLVAAGAPVERMMLGEARVGEASGREILAKLELGVAKK
jgi:hypothetical protein